MKNSLARATGRFPVLALALLMLIAGMLFAGSAQAQTAGCGDDEYGDYGDTTPVPIAEGQADSFDFSACFASGNATGWTHTLIQAPAHGSLSFSGATVTYTPNAGYTGSDYMAINTSGTADVICNCYFTITVNVVAPPTVTSISPTAGPVTGGTSVTITGTGFTGATAVTFGGAAATGVTVVSATTITATTPVGTAGTASVLVTTPYGTNAANSLYTYVAAPTVSAISPSSGTTAGGTSVTITGTGFTGATAVTFGGAAATGVTVVSTTTITATTPVGTAGTASVLVTTPYGTNAANSLYTYVAAPTVSAISPSSGTTAGGTSVTITGTSFTGATAVAFGGAAATGVTVVSATTITATTPVGTAGTASVLVTTPYGTNAANSLYTYVAAPTVSAISPSSGTTAGGTSVTITGTSFTGATAVTFGGTAATSYTVVSATTITATSPTGTGTVDLRVTTTGGASATSAADQFTYIAAPTVTSISPTVGPVTGGTSVTITGTSFTGATAVTFGGTAATSFTVVSATTITATSPTGTGTVDLRVTTTGGASATSAADQFTYIAAPTVTSISPTVGPVTGGTSVTITGTGFTGATAVTFGGTAATSYTVVSATTITATSPTGTGTADIRVTTTGGTSATSASDRFTYGNGPAVSNVTPVGGTIAGGKSVTITGTNLTGATSVTFGGTAATSFTVTGATAITATTPAHAAGAVDIVVTTPFGTSTTGTPDRYTYVAPAVATAVSTSVAHGSSANTIALAITGGTATSVTVATGASHGTATASGTAITYTPAASYSGSDSFTYTATNLAGTSAPATVTITVNAPTLSFTPAAPTGGTVGHSYDLALGTASGGTAPYGYAVASGALPPGITLDGTTDTLAGTPTSDGSYSFTIKATDSSTGTGAPFSRTSASLTLTVAAPTLALTPASGTTLNPIYAASFSQSFSASGGTAPYSYAESGTLPTGLSFSGGTLSGTPAETGRFPITVTATDSTSPTHATITNSYTLVVTAPSPTVSAVAPTGGPATGGTRVTITGTGFTGATAVTFGGTAATSFTVNSATSITATAPAHADGTIDVTVIRPGGSSATVAADRFAYETITLSPTTGSTLPQATVGTAYSQAVTAAGGTTPYSYSIAGQPAWLAINASSGTITNSGTAVEGKYSGITVTATDAHGVSGTAAYSLAVAPAAITLPATLDAMTDGVAFSQSLAATGGVAPYAYAVSSGTLPPGVSLNATSGLLSGTPTAAGRYAFTLTATDADRFTGSRGYSVTVAAPTLALAPATLPVPVIGTAYSQSFTTTGGIAPYSYSATGTLPTGLTLAAGGTLSGTPSTAGTFAFTVKSSDSSTGTGAPFSTTRSYTLTVNPLPPVTHAVSQTVAYDSSADTVTLDITGGTPAAVAVATKPSHGTATASGTTITYTPATGYAGPDSLTYTASNAGGTSAAAIVTITVSAPTLTLAPTALPSGTFGTAYPAVTVTATGGAAPYAYAETGTLPTGISFSAGTFSGTPAQSGSFPITVKATDSSTGTGPFSKTISYTLVIKPPAAPVVGAKSATTPYATATAINLSGSITGIDITAVTVASGPSHGSASVSGETVTYTPSSSFYGGTDSFTYTATNPGGTSSPATVTITIGKPAVPVVAAKSVTAPYDTAAAINLSASITGVDVTAVTVTTGPSHGTASVSGETVTYTPSSSFYGGTDSFTYTATNPSGTSSPATVTITIGKPAAPVAAAVSATTEADQPVTIDVTKNDTGIITGIALGTQPTHGKATVSGLAVIYTPVTNYAGTDSFTYEAVGPGGKSAPATVTVTVKPLAVPTVANLTETITGTTPLTIDPTVGATGGPFTAAAVPTQPKNGSVRVSGLKLVYTADSNFSGTDSFTYTLSNAFGASKPGTVAVTVRPQAGAASLTATATSAGEVTVNLSDKATGGPFTAAHLVSVAPASAGSATITDPASGKGPVYELHFRARPSFSGTVVVTYTLSNAFSTSAPATVTITVVPRANPSADADVLGLLSAQLDAAKRFSTGQISNINDRLDALHDGNCGASSNGVSVTVDGKSLSPDQADDPTQQQNGATNGTIRETDRAAARDPGNKAKDAASAGAPDGCSELPGHIALWTGGTIDFGSRNGMVERNGSGFDTEGVTLGADYRMSQSLVFGLGGGYGHDHSDIGNDGTRSTADSYSVALYASFRPADQLYLDGIIGTGWLGFDSVRFAAAVDAFATGHRDGEQDFASLTGGYLYKDEQWNLSPYGRIDLISANLDRSTERGAGAYALTYFGESMTSVDATLGFRGSYDQKLSFGRLEPKFDIEFEHDFDGQASTILSYADDPTTLYRALALPADRNQINLELGTDLELDDGLTLGLAWGTTLADSQQHDNIFKFKIARRF